VSESSKGKRQIEHSQQAQQVFETFIAEIRFRAEDPAIPILGYLEMLLLEKFGPLTDKQQEILTNVKNVSCFWRRIFAEIHLASQLVNDRLHLKKPPLTLQQNSRSIMKQINLEQAIQETVLAVSEYNHIIYPSEELTIKTRISNELRDVQGDASWLRQAMTWLITAYLPGVEIIELSASCDNRKTMITVSPKKKPIYNYEYSSRLFLSRMIVKKHGGRLLVDSKEGNSNLILPIDENKRKSPGGNLYTLRCSSTKD
jgi:signal transduction histidine kinase